MGNQISLVIPHYPSKQTDIALDDCIKSYEGYYDQLIVIVNDGMGYGPAVNLGLKYATHDYIIVSNNDMKLLKGSLRDLANTKGVVVPKIVPPAKDHMPRAIFGMPRWVYETLLRDDGFFYDPIFKTGYWEDDDLIKRLNNISIYLEVGVIVEHLNGGGMTMKQMGESEWHEKNREVFNNKWS